MHVAGRGRMWIVALGIGLIPGPLLPAAEPAGRSETDRADARHVRRQLAQARLATEAGNLDEARAVLESVLSASGTSAELRILARARLARVAMLQRTQVQPRRPAAATALPDPPAAVPEVASSDSRSVVQQAQARVVEGWAAISAGDYHDAQALFNMAIALVPAAPRRTVRIKPYSGFDTRGIAVSGTLHRTVSASPDGWMTANVQLGLGRLVGMRSFQFSGGPRTGVGGSGWVQLPNVQRTQINTTVTVPAYALGRTHDVMVEQLLVFTLPEL